MEILELVHNYGISNGKRMREKKYNVEKIVVTKCYSLFYFAKFFSSFGYSLEVTHSFCSSSDSTAQEDDLAAEHNRSKQVCLHYKFNLFMLPRII